VPPPTFSHVQPGVLFPAFATLMMHDFIKAVRRLPDKSSAADHLLTTILKQVVDLLSPFMTELFNRSLPTGRFPAGFRQAFITPIVNKPGLYATDASSYRPISNSSVLFKLLEHLVAVLDAV